MPEAYGIVAEDSDKGGEDAMAKTVAAKRRTTQPETVLAGDVRDHLGRVLTMLNEVYGQMPADNPTTEVLIDGLLRGAIDTLTDFRKRLY
jgi:hypothetical protein